MSEELERYVIDEFGQILTVLKYIVRIYGKQNISLKPKEILGEQGTKEELERYLKYLSVYQIIETMDMNSSKDYIIANINPHVLGFYMDISEKITQFFETDDYGRKLLCLRRIFKEGKTPHCEECCDYDE